MANEAPHCLVISDGRRGIENQALGLAEACASLRPLSLQTHHIAHNHFIAALPPRAQMRLAKFDLPACDVAIGCGRQAIAPLLHLKKRAPKVMAVYVQDPRMDPSSFDLVIAPKHDSIRGENVETMIGSPNRVTREKIIQDTLNFATGLTKIPMPRAALLIGGNSKTHQLDKASHEAHIKAARTLTEAGISILITTSRRTPEFAVLAWRRFASDFENVWLHDGEGPNPYYAFLGGAEMILVTEDSTNMLTEACGTGKPVYRLPMSGQAGKFEALYRDLDSRCGAAIYSGQLTGKDYPPLLETARVAQRLWERFDARGQA